MVKILLSCNTDTYDIAKNLKAIIELQLGFNVALDMEDESSSHSDDEEDSFQEDEVTEATVLLVFQFGDESISAWITIEETDEKYSEECKYEQDDFPEIINFSSSVSRGIRILKCILVQDFGLIVRSNEEQSTPKAPVTVASKCENTGSKYIDAQTIKERQELEAAKNAVAMASGSKPGMLSKLTNLFGKSRRRLSQ
ncbi:MAG: hypothetical protein SGBAC_002525 [Bacillariaceae sp.]